MRYSEIKELPADAFLNPELFRTIFDGQRDEENYNRGLIIGRAATRLSIADNGVWGAQLTDGASVGSYEGIGYHASTYALLLGFLASGTPIFVYRWNDRQRGCWRIEGTTCIQVEG